MSYDYLKSLSRLSDNNILLSLISSSATAVGCTKNKVQKCSRDMRVKRSFDEFNKAHSADVEPLLSEYLIDTT